MARAARVATRLPVARIVIVAIQKEQVAQERVELRLGRLLPRLAAALAPARSRLCRVLGSPRRSRLARLLPRHAAALGRFRRLLLLLLPRLAAALALGRSGSLRLLLLLPRRVGGPRMGHPLQHVEALACSKGVAGGRGLGLRLGSGWVRLEVGRRWRLGRARPHLPT